MGHQMRVIVCGSDFAKINKIAVTTFLDGLYVEYKEKLCIVFYGKGHVSDIVEEWVGKTWPSSNSRNCFNLEWVIEHWSGDDVEDIASCIVKEARPDLAFLFGYDKYELARALRYAEVPAFILEKL
jgi:hypothetical protein